MQRIRKFEEDLAEQIKKGNVKTPCHLYIGQEAVAVGVCSALRKSDVVFSTHRSHGHYLAKGGNESALLNEIMGNQDGCCQGRGGSMHIADPKQGLLGSSAIVAGTISIAVGSALGFKLQGKDNVAVAFFGDGATAAGVFYESLNFAALHKLPVIFVCENNLYCTHLHITQCLADTSIKKKAEAMGVVSILVDGNNVEKVHEVACHAVEHARSGNGPVLIECSTYRYLGHVGASDDLDKGLRSREELEYWKRKDPLEVQ